MTSRSLPAPTVTADARSTLADLMLRRVLEPARSVGLDLATLEPTVIPSRQEVCWTDFEAWLFVESSTDPTAPRHEGKIPVPLAIDEHLSLLIDAGVEPDLVWLAHQLPATWLDGDEIPDLVPPPAHLHRIDHALLTPVRGAKKFAGLLAEIAPEIPRGFVAFVDDVTRGDCLDPVVLGGVKHPTLPIAQWAILAQWTWD